MVRFAALAVSVLAILAPAAAGGGQGQEIFLRERPETVPGDAELEAAGAVVGSIRIRTGDVFDTSIPEEDRWLFRTANRLHWKTREGVVRKLLLFREGDRYRGRLLKESERLLRQTKYLYDARILPVDYSGGRVGIEVVTRDVWTLQAGLGFSRSGGENSTRIGLQDANFLGTGKDLTVRRTSDVDRASVLYRYRDFQLLGSRLRLIVQYRDNSDGLLRQFDLTRPFFSLDTRWSASAGAGSFDQVQSLYERGEVSSRFRHRREFYTLQSGLSRGQFHGTTRRWLAGLTYEEDRFLAAPGEIAPVSLPGDRTLVYPWIGFETISAEFLKLRNLDRLQRTEDFNFGHELFASLGWSDDGFGADRDVAVFRSRARIGHTPREGRLWLFAAYASGRYGSGRGENVLAGGSVRLFARNFRRHNFYASLSVAAAANLDGENQLLLGGDRGLRGYPLRYVHGDRRFLLTLEQRLYTDWYPFRLVHVGAAVFLDVGRAWTHGSAGAGEPGVLKDIGVGLRFGSSRSSDASMVHVDLAIPLDRDAGIDSVQFLVTTQETF